MAINHNSVVFDVTDFKVYPLVSDSGQASPTYNTGIDVPGIASVSLSPEYVSATLKGDAKVIATKARIDSFTMSAQYGRVDLDVMKTIMGGTVTDAGSGTTETATYGVTGGQQAPYFKVAAMIDDTELSGGAIVIVAYKCMLSAATVLDQSSESFGQPTMDITAIQPLHTDTNMVEVIFYETAPTL